MSDLWARIQKLEGQTLRTAARQEPFEVMTVSAVAVIVKLESSHAPRFLRRRDFEEAVLYGPKGSATSPRAPSAESPGPEPTAAYVAAILRAVGELP